MKKLHKHHRKPSSIGGGNDAGNLSYVPHGMHEAWHKLFKNFPAEDIVRLINDFWLDPDYEVVLRRRLIRPTESAVYIRRVK